MTALLASIAARYGLPKWVVVLVASLALLALVAGGFGLWLSHHDDGVIENDRAASKVEALQADRSATRAADEADAKAEAQARAEADSIQKDIANATASHPEQARAPAGPATSAVTDRLRNRAR